MKIRFAAFQWAGAAILAIAFATAASATVFNIDEVIEVTGGFNASGFHDASNGSPMSGNGLAVIDPGTTGVSGMYNDGDGSFTAILPVTTLSGFGSVTSVSLVGTLGFSGGTLSAATTLQATFTGTFTDGDWAFPSSFLVDPPSDPDKDGVIGAALLGFNPGYVCCGIGLNPNSLQSDGGPIGGKFMTLWGADGFILPTSPATDGTYDITKALIGMDLRIHLTPKPEAPPPPPPRVSEPNSLAIFGLGLAGLGFMRRRRRKKRTAGS